MDETKGDEMTPEELANIRLNARVEILTTMMRGLYVALAHTAPSVADSMRETFSKLRTSSLQMTLNDTHPAMSDLLAGEYQEVLNEILTFFEDGFPPD